jgi:hypothetical protein
MAEVERIEDAEVDTSDDHDDDGGPQRGTVFKP